MAKIDQKQRFSIKSPFSWRPSGLIMRGEADLHENRLFVKNIVFAPVWAILGPSRPQKWIRLEIPVKMVVSGGLET